MESSIKYFREREPALEGQVLIINHIRDPYESEAHYAAIIDHYRMMRGCTPYLSTVATAIFDYYDLDLNLISSRSEERVAIKDFQYDSNWITGGSQNWYRVFRRPRDARNILDDLYVGDKINTTCGKMQITKLPDLADPEWEFVVYGVPVDDPTKEPVAILGTMII